MKRSLLVVILLGISGFLFSAKVIGVKLGETELDGSKIVLAKDLIVNGPAQKQGVRIGDWIIRVGKKKTDNLAADEVTQLIAEQAGKGKVELTVKRGPVTNTIKITPVSSVDIERVLEVEGEMMEQIPGFFISDAFAVDFTSPKVDTGNRKISVNKKKKEITITDKIDDNLSENITGLFTVEKDEKPVIIKHFVIFSYGKYEAFYEKPVDGIRMTYKDKVLTTTVSLKKLPKKYQDLDYSYKLKDDAGNESFFLKPFRSGTFTKIEGEFPTNQSSSSSSGNVQKEPVTIQEGTTNLTVSGQEITALTNGISIFQDRLSMFTPVKSFSLEKTGFYSVMIKDHELVFVHSNGNVSGATVTKDSFYRGIPIKKDSSVYFSDNGDIFNLKLETNSVIDHFQVLKNSEVILDPNGKLFVFQTAADTNINKTPVSKGDKIIIRTNGIISIVTLDYGVKTVNGMKLVGKNMFSDEDFNNSDNSTITVYPNGKLKSGLLAEPYKNKGKTYTGMITYYENGNVETCTMSNTVNFRNWVLDGNVTFYPDGNVKNGVVLKPVKTGQIPLMEKSYVSFFSNGNIDSCNIGQDFTYDGYPVGRNYTRFHPNGKLFTFSTSSTNLSISGYQLIPYANIALYDNGKPAILFVRDPVDCVLKKYNQTVKVNQRIYLDRDGNVIGGSLPEKTVIDGKERPQYTFYIVEENGDVSFDKSVWEDEFVKKGKR